MAAICFGLIELSQVITELSRHSGYFQAPLTFNGAPGRLEIYRVTLTGMQQADPRILDQKLVAGC